MFSYFTSFMENPREMLIFLLLSTPGRLMALSLHEFAPVSYTHLTLPPIFRV